MREGGAGEAIRRADLAYFAGSRWIASAFGRAMAPCRAEPQESAGERSREMRHIAGRRWCRWRRGAARERFCQPLIFFVSAFVPRSWNETTGTAG